MSDQRDRSRDLRPDAPTGPAIDPALDVDAATRPASEAGSAAPDPLLQSEFVLDPYEEAEEREDRAALQRSPRFRLEALVGAGGMGRVYKVFDHSLQRYAALKVLRLPGAQNVHRFLQEAKAQARVEHRNVCTVYEAGEIEGRYFIAMQFIDGQPLSRFGTAAGGAASPTTLTLEEMAGVFCQVAEGIHAAHRLGLVHRDIKPSNVLLTRAGDEGWRPYVVDFGIARELSGPQVTATGALIGTPAYMAPEQVRGTGVDRRTDVYGLGVTMYQLLAGRLPIGTTSSLDALARVLAEEPRPLRDARPDVPADLEAVVMKCLEKDPGRRYESARALAEDLTRFLEGEPVRARPVTWRSQLARKVRKNRTAVALSAAAAAALLVLGVVAVRERWLAGEMARQAQRFGREAESMEWLLRAAHELPLHDTTPARDLIRTQLQTLEAQLPALGRGARGPAAYALGRGYLALDEEDRAGPRLETAWREGYRGPEVAYARGMVLVRGYERALERARGLRDADEQRAAMEDARRRFRAPAVELLGQSAQAVTAAPEYLAALLSFLEGDVKAGLARARAAVERLPWLYEARLLEAELQRGEADRASDPALAERSLAAAESALQDAVRRGESDPRAYTDLCALAVDRMARSQHGSGEGVAAFFESARQACGQALVADPTHLRAQALEVTVLTAMAGWELDRGVDPAPRLADAERVARATVAAHPGRPEAHRALAAVWQQQARVRRNHGGDVPAALREAIASLERSLAAGGPPDWKALQELGNAQGYLAVQQQERGEDPTPLQAASQRTLEQAIALAPQVYSIHFNLGRTLGDMADRALERGGDPRPSLDAAATSYRRALELKPDYPQVHNSLGVTLLHRAQSAPRFQADPGPHLEESIRHLERAIAIQSSYANPRFNLGLVHRARAAVEAGAGRDPWPELERAAASFRAGLAINPNVFFAYLEMARGYVSGADWEREHGRSPDKALAQARELVARSLKAVPDDFMALLVLGEALLVEAEWDLGRGREPATLPRARSVLEQARTSNPEDAQIYAGLAEVERLAAERAARRHEPLEAALAAGHRQVEASLARNATAASPHITAGRLWLVSARAAKDAGSRREAAVKAQQAFATALRLEAGQEQRLAPTVAEASRLAG